MHINFDRRKDGLRVYGKTLLKLILKIWSEDVDWSQLAQDRV